MINVNVKLKFAKYFLMMNGDACWQSLFQMCQDMQQGTFILPNQSI